MPATRTALAAVAFLTRVPVGSRLELNAAEVARGAALFPLVGAGIGAAGGGVAALTVHVLPTLAAGALAVAAAAILTGALHLDALADTADALGGLSRQQALEIMRDHRIGSFGAIALALDLIVRASVTGALAAAGGAVAALAAAGACSRAVAPSLAAALPHARASAPGHALTETWSWTAAATAATFGLAIPVLFVGIDGLAAAGVVALVAIALGLFYHRWLGGVTGDCLGAAVELAETLALATLLALRGVSA
jgi:adenosylcobinamide-GDP ribazoletransferase